MSRKARRWFRRNQVYKFKLVGDLFPDIIDDFWFKPSPWQFYLEGGEAWLDYKRKHGWFWKDYIKHYKLHLIRKGRIHAN